MTANHSTQDNRDAAIGKALRTVRQQCSTANSHPPPTNTIVDAMLDGLGWERFSEQISYDFELSGSGRSADYALKTSETAPVVAIELVEADDCKNHLSKYSATLKYAADSNAPIYVMTTGTTWDFYSTKEANNKNPKYLNFLTLDILDDTISLDTLMDNFKNILSIELVSSGHAWEIADLLLKTQLEETLLKEQLPLIWKKMLDDGDDKLLAVLGRRAHEKLGIKADKEQLEAVVKSTYQSAAKRSKKDANKRKVNPEAYILFGAEHEIDVHVKALIHITETLQRRDPTSFVRLLELPYFSRNPEDFRSSAEINDTGIYLDKLANASTIWNRASKIMRHLGHTPYDLNLVYRPTSPH